MTETIETRLRRVADRDEIRDLAARYCMGGDRKDFALFRSVFHADSTHRHGAFEGLSLDFARRAEWLLPFFKASQHMLGTSLIQFESDDVATGETYFQAFHHLAADAPVPRHTEGKEEIWWVGGRYIDRYERRDGVWKIARRVGVHDWEKWEEVNDRGFAPTILSTELTPA